MHDFHNKEHSPSNNEFDIIQFGNISLVQKYIGHKNLLHLYTLAENPQQVIHNIRQVTEQNSKFIGQFELDDTFIGSSISARRLVGAIFTRTDYEPPSTTISFDQFAETLKQHHIKIIGASPSSIKVECTFKEVFSLRNEQVTRQVAIFANETIRIFGTDIFVSPTIDKDGATILCTATKL